MRVPKQSSGNRVTLNKKRKTVPIRNKKAVAKNGDDIIIDLRREEILQSVVRFIRRDFKHLPQAPMPANLKPMLASVTSEPFNDANWLFEIKWDGYRALSYLQNGKVNVCSRNNNSFDKKFFPVHDALKAWPVNAVVDGEVVVLDENGKPDFGGLQQWHRTHQGHLFYYVFDLLWLDGLDLTGEPLHRRKDALKKIVPDNGLIRYSDAIEEYGTRFFEAAKNGGLEGIIAKEKDSIYQAGTRTTDWYKIKAEERHEAVICGYTKNKDTDRLFSSLVLGVPKKDGTMEFIGQVGTGFTGRSQREIFKKMNPLFTPACPFEKKPNTGAPTMWVKPQLICEIKYTERTAEGLMRHPSFQGLREDKTIKEFNG